MLQKIFGIGEVRELHNNELFTPEPPTEPLESPDFALSGPSQNQRINRIGIYPHVQDGRGNQNWKVTS